jgi:hypothetical protein
VGSTRDAEAHHHHGGVSALLLDDETTFAQLGSFHRVDFRDSVRRSWDGAEFVDDRLEDVIVRAVVAGHHHCGVVGPVKLIVKGLEPRQRDVFDVGEPADDGMVVGVCIECGGAELLDQDREGAVFAVFELVAHDGHLGVAVILAQVEVAHAVCFHGDELAEVLGGHLGEVVGAVVGGGGVVVCTERREHARRSWGIDRCP